MITVRLANGARAALNAKATAEGREPNIANPGSGSEPLTVTMTVLSGEDLYHFIPVLDEDASWWDSEYTRFVFDLDSLTYNERIPIDFNHNDTEVIGSLEQIRVENGQLVGRGTIVPFRPDDRAAEVAYKSQFIPYGVSPLVTFDEAEAVRVRKGETLEVNGRTYTGKITVIKNAKILGAAVTPYPTDGGTGITAALGKNTKGILTMSILKPEPGLANNSVEVSAGPSGSPAADQRSANAAELDADLDVAKKNEGAGDEIDTSDNDRNGAGGADSGNADPDAGGEDAGENKGAGEENGGGVGPAPVSGDGGGENTGGETGGGGEGAGGETEGDGPAEPVTGGEDGEGEGGAGGEGGEGGDGGDAALRKEVAALRKEVAALRKEVAKTAGLARHGGGTEPVGFSCGGQAEMSYADAVAARLEKLRNE